MTETRKLRVFLCYSSQDKPIVHELYQRLNAEGWIDPWLDTAKLLPGQHWTRVIKQAIDTADLVVVFISKNSINKEGFVQREMNYAWDRSLEKPRNIIFLIPIRLENCDVPYDLREKQWVDYFGARREETYEALLQSLKFRYEQVIRFELIESDNSSESRHLNVDGTVENSTDDQLLGVSNKNISPDASKISQPIFSVSFIQSTISIETLGGMATPIFYRGDSLPLETTITFSTAADDQTAVELHLVLGENKLAADNISLGKFVLDGIPLARRGVPQIDVQFKVNQDLVLSVIATEKTTGKTKNVQNLKLGKVVPPPVKDPLPPKVEYPASDNVFGLGGFGNFISSIFSGRSNKIPSSVGPEYSNQDYDINTSLEISFVEAALGAECEIEIHRYDTCVDCNGSGLAFALPCLKCEGEGKYLNKFRFKARVPAGVYSGAKVRFPAVGHVRQNGSRGDVYTLISVEAHPFFTKKDSDLYIKYPIPKRLALQGGELQIPLLEKGGFVWLNIPLNTREKQTFRISNYGITKLKSPAQRGDLYVIVETYDPKKMPQDVKKILTFINSHLKK